MLFATLGKVRAGTTKERIARRVQWTYPQGARLVAEYWLLGGEVSVISLVEADSAAPIMSAIAEWDDVFNFTVAPAVTAEEGLQLAQQLLKAA
jgi:hypothetical protein